jgi:hypothetical protein
MNISMLPLNQTGINTRFAKVRDLWSHQDLGVFDMEFLSRVNPHGVVMYKITPRAAEEVEMEDLPSVKAAVKGKMDSIIIQ